MAGSFINDGQTPASQIGLVGLHPLKPYAASNPVRDDNA